MRKYLHANLFLPLDRGAGLGGYHAISCFGANARPIGFSSDRFLKIPIKWATPA
jgi:hypothetical protein